MSIIHSFDPNSEAILNPLDSIVPVENLPETVIGTFNPKFFALLGKMATLEECAILKINGCSRPVYRFEFGGKVLGIFHTMLGGSASAAMLEELIAMGAKRVLYFGSSGALDKNLVEGHLVVPTAAYRDEGVSYHYLPASDYVEIATAESLCEILDSLNVPYVKAKTWTTDAVHRETRANMEKRKSEGCTVVEMECASVMAVGQFRKVPIYQFLYAADCLDAAQWDKRFLGNMPEDMRERILTVALNAAAKLNLGEIMLLYHENLTIRNATAADAEQLAAWWNDGSVMAHAGFPNGLGITAEEIVESLAKDVDGLHHRHIIEENGVAIGEMNYRSKGNGVVEIGIKICNPSCQNRGLGKKLLRMFIDGLFNELGFSEIILDTNLNNLRAQHVYESLGFEKVRVNIDSWTDQLGRKQSSVDYRMKNPHIC